MYIFKNIFKKFSSFFCFVFYSVCFSAYYICKGNERRKPDSPANSFFLYLFFYICRRDGCSPAGIVPGVVAVSFFVEKKEKKEKERNGAGVSLKKKRYFSRFNFCYLDCRSLKCHFGKARLPKLFYQDLAAGSVLVLLRAAHNTAAAKSAHLYETPRRCQLKSVHTSRTLTPEPLQQIFLQREQLFKR